jgi:nitric oxide reductase subunit B
MLGMGAYLGPDFSTEFLHKRAEFLNDHYAKEFYKKPWASLSVMEQGAIKARTIQDMKEQTVLKESGVVYTDGSALAYQANVNYLVHFLTKGDKARA